MSIRRFKDFVPNLADDVIVDESAVIIGNVTIGKGSSVWPCTVIRGDIHAIVIGHYTNVQDGSVLHVTHKSKFNPDGFPLHIGNRVTIGHSVVLHGATIQDDCLIGMRSVVMDGTVLDPFVMVAAGSLVPPGKHLTTGLWVGSPVKRIRDLTQEEIEFIGYSANHYSKLAKAHQEVR